MKVRTGFISNSSSTSFLITNTSNEIKTLVDFVEENPQLVEEFNVEYEASFTQKEMILDAKKKKLSFRPKVEKECTFGDDEGTIIGRVFDYILRNGGESKSFTWEFYEWKR